MRLRLGENAAHQFVIRVGLCCSQLFLERIQKRQKAARSTSLRRSKPASRKICLSMPANGLLDRRRTVVQQGAPESKPPQCRRADFAGFG